MLSRRYAHTEGEAEAYCLILVESTGTWNGNSPQSRPGDCGRVLGTRYPNHPLPLDPQRDYACIPQSSDYATYLVTKAKIRIPVFTRKTTNIWSMTHEVVYGLGAGAGVAHPEAS